MEIDTYCLTLRKTLISDCIEMHKVLLLCNLIDLSCCSVKNGLLFSSEKYWYSLEINEQRLYANI